LNIKNGREFGERYFITEGNPIVYRGRAELGDWRHIPPFFSPALLDEWRRGIVTRFSFLACFFFFSPSSLRVWITGYFKGGTSLVEWEDLSLGEENISIIHGCIVWRSRQFKSSLYNRNGLSIWRQYGHPRWPSGLGFLAAREFIGVCVSVDFTLLGSILWVVCKTAFIWRLLPSSATLSLSLFLVPFLFLCVFVFPFSFVWFLCVSLCLCACVETCSPGLVPCSMLSCFSACLSIQVISLAFPPHVFFPCVF
jgi:hypothetical protein